MDPENLWVLNDLIIFQRIHPFDGPSGWWVSGPDTFHSKQLKEEGDRGEDQNQKHGAPEERGHAAADGRNHHLQRPGRDRQKAESAAGQWGSVSDWVGEDMEFGWQQLRMMSVDHGWVCCSPSYSYLHVPCYMYDVCVCLISWNMPSPRVRYDVRSHTMSNMRAHHQATKDLDTVESKT